MILQRSDKILQIQVYVTFLCESCFVLWCIVDEPNEDREDPLDHVETIVSSSQSNNT